MDNRYTKTGFGSVTEAIYKKPLCEMDKGSVLIEAIPEAITDEKELIRYYTVHINNDFKSRTDLNDNQKRIMLDEIRRVRFFLPFDDEIEKEFSKALFNSYRSRKMVLDKKSGTYKSEASTCDGTNPGFGVIGYSGCGKSTAFKLLLDHYPQVIVHELKEGQLIQILYLAISCIPNSNFQALYGQIGRAIDQALKVEIYENMINGLSSLGKKQNKIVELIERFNIGMIIFDEIQLINFSSNKENSYESLMTISNRTKVAMCVIGTEESYNKMFFNLKTARRIGRPIPASLYCENKGYISQIIKTLFRYQVFEQEVKPDNDIIEAFQEETKGIIDMIIMLFIAIQDEYLSNKKRPTIDGQFVRKVMNDRYSRLKELLSLCGKDRNDATLQKLLKEAKIDNEYKIEVLKQNEIMTKAIENFDTVDISNISEQVIKSIQIVTSEFNVEDINKAIKQVIGTKNIEFLNVDDLTKATFKLLKAKPLSTSSKPAQSKTKKKTEDMLNELLSKQSI